MIEKKIEFLNCIHSVEKVPILELSLIFAPTGRDYLAHLIRNPHSLIVKIFGLFRLNGPGPPLVLIVMQSVRSRFWRRALPSALCEGVFPGQPDRCEIRHQRLHGRKVQRNNDFFNLGFTMVITRTPRVPSRNYWVSARSKNQTKWPIEIWTLKQEMETDGDHTTMSHLIGASHWSRIYVSCSLVGKYGWKFVGDYSIWFGFLIMYSQGNSWCPYPF